MIQSTKVQKYAQRLNYPLPLILERLYLSKLHTNHTAFVVRRSFWNELGSIFQSLFAQTVKVIEMFDFLEQFGFISMIYAWRTSSAHI